jgi:hypothetical protein
MDRTGLKISAKSPTKVPVLKTSRAESGALLNDVLDKFPDLAALITAWPTLPDDVRRQIMELLRGK